MFPMTKDWPRGLLFYPFLATVVATHVQNFVILYPIAVRDSRLVAARTIVWSPHANRTVNIPSRTRTHQERQEFPRPTHPRTEAARRWQLELQMQHMTNREQSCPPSEAKGHRVLPLPEVPKGNVEFLDLGDFLPPDHFRDLRVFLDVM